MQPFVCAGVFWHFSDCLMELSLWNCCKNALWKNTLAPTIAVSYKLSFIYDSEVLYLLPSSMKLGGITCVSLIQLVMLIVSLFTLSSLFTEPRVGKVWAKRLEGDLRSPRNCRHIYALLADATAVAADTLYSLISRLTQWSQPWCSSNMPPLSRWSSHICTLHTICDQVSTLWHACSVL